PLLEGGRRPPIEIDVEVGGVRVSGFLRDVYPKGQVDWRYSRLGGRHEIRFWVRHCLLGLLGERCTTFLAGRPAKDDDVRLAGFRPPGDPQAILAELVRLYRAALRFPVPLFPESSRLYVAELRRLGGEPDAKERAFRKVREEFVKKRNGEGAFGDGADEYVVKLFGEREEPPEGRDFAAIARAVFEPLLRHRDPES
ncbi:MAG: hypothetical protein ACREQY_07880, partial [Candidatus Binatia bacterium]